MKNFWGALHPSLAKSSARPWKDSIFDKLGQNSCVYPCMYNALILLPNFKTILPQNQYYVITLHLHAFFVISVLVKITDITIFLGAQIDFCRVSSLIIFFSDQRLPAILYCILVLFHVQL